MGVKNLTRDAMLTLCGVFNEGVSSFRGAALSFPPDETGPARDIAQQFQDAAALTHVAYEDSAPGMLPGLDSQIGRLVTTLAGLTDPRLLQAAEDVRFGEKVAYKNLGSQARDDLGSYGRGIFGPGGNFSG